MTILENVKVRLGNPEGKDSLLNVLIDDAKLFAVNYCHLKEYSSTLDSVVAKMVVIDYNRIGTEGLASESVSGISESYVEGYGETINQLLNKERRLKTL